MDDFKEVLWFGVSAITAAIILSVYIALGNVTGNMAAIRHNDILTAQLAYEARRHNIFDGAVVTGADVIAVLRENTLNRGAYVITVLNTDGTVFAEQNVNNYTNASWRYTSLRSVIPAASLYDAETTELGITFTRRAGT